MATAIGQKKSRRAEDIKRINGKLFQRERKIKEETDIQLCMSKGWKRRENGNVNNMVYLKLRKPLEIFEMGSENGLIV